jgi:GT2 family glycosyltransferase
MLNYNSSDETLLCLKSLEHVTFSHVDIFIIDNCSSNADFLNLKNHIPANITLIRNNINSGFAGGVNVGLRAAIPSNPDYFLLLNNDVVVDSDFLIELVHALQSDAMFGLAGPVVYDFFDSSCISSAGISLRWHTFVFPHSITYKKSKLPENLKETEALEGSALLIKSQVVNAIGWLDSSYFLQCEEVDYCIRARNAGFKCVLVPTSMIWHKGGGSSTKKGYSKEILYYITRGRLQIARKHFGKAELVRLSLLYMLPVVRRLMSGKKDVASWQARAIIDAWVHVSGGKAYKSGLK